jgi:tubulin--tyrosine ligase
VSQAFAANDAAGKGRTWLVKPASLNRGNGIELFSCLADMLQHLRARKSGSQWVVQKYIEQPALVSGGRKFDIRAYVLLTPEGGVYMANEAYARTSSTPFCLDDLSNKAAHLTNDAVQKHLSSYHSFEDHCKLSMEALQVRAQAGAAVCWTAAC